MPWRQKFILQGGLVSSDFLVLLKVALALALVYGVAILTLVAYGAFRTSPALHDQLYRSFIQSVVLPAWMGLFPYVLLVMGLGGSQEDREKRLWWMYGALPASPSRILFQRIAAALLGGMVHVLLVVILAGLHDVFQSNGSLRILSNLFATIEMSAGEVWMDYLFRCLTSIFIGITAGVLTGSALGSFILAATLAVLARLDLEPVILVLCLFLFPWGLKRRIAHGGGETGEGLWSELLPRFGTAIPQATTTPLHPSISHAAAFRCPSPGWRLIRHMTYGWLAAWIPVGLLMALSQILLRGQSLDQWGQLLVHSFCTALLWGALWPDRYGLEQLQQTRATLPRSGAGWFWSRIGQGLVGMLLLLTLTTGLSWFHKPAWDQQPYWFMPSLILLGLTPIMAFLSLFDYSRIGSALLSVCLGFGLSALLGIILYQGHNRLPATALLPVIWTTITPALLCLFGAWLALVHSPLPTLDSRRRSQLLVPVTLILAPYLLLMAGMPPWHLLMLIWPPSFF